MKASIARNAMANSRRASCTETAVVPYPKPSVLLLAAVAVDVENVRVGPCRGGAEVARADLDDPDLRRACVQTNTIRQGDE
jgi:hypothetical protein